MSANDNFASAIEIAGLSGSVSGNNSTDTLEPGEPTPDSGNVPIGRSVWFRWTPPSESFTDLHIVSGLDTVVAVYIGASLDALQEVAHNDETTVPGKSSSLTFLAGAGVEYHIQVSSWNATAGGAFEMQWSPVSVTALDITGNSGTVTGTTPSGAEPASWFRWVPDSDDVVEFDMFGTDTGGTAYSALTVMSPFGALKVEGAGQNGSWPTKLAFLAAAQASCYIKVQYEASAGVGGPFTLRWAVGSTQTNSWYSAGAYWRANREDTELPGNAPLVKAPAPIAKLLVRTPTNPALTKTTNPGSSLYLAGGSPEWYLNPPDKGQEPLLGDWFKGVVSDPKGFITGSLPFYDQFAPLVPPLGQDYSSNGLFSVGGFVRPVFGPSRADQAAFDLEFVLPDGVSTQPYLAPVIAALSGFSLAEWTAGTSSGEALQGFVSRAAMAPYQPSDLILGVHAVVAGDETRSDTVYVDGTAVRVQAVLSETDDALSVRMSIQGTNPSEVTVISVRGFGAGSGATAQTHGTRTGLTDVKYVYQAQFTASVDYTVASQFTMLTQPYWLGPPPAAFWGQFANSAEAVRVVT